MRFSTHDEEGLGKKFVEAPEMWKKTEDMVRRTLVSGGINYEEVSGEAAFYGPKIDVEIWSAIGREFTIATNQVDFAVPERFGLSYVNSEGNDEVPLCIHRAPLGTHERTVGFLIEHYAGAFPLWLAPVQAVVLPIAERHAEYGAKILAALKARGVRAEIHADQTLNYRIRAAQKKKVPYMMILGDREVEEEQISIRERSGENLDPMSLAAVLDMVTGKISSRSGQLQ
jgi:threonyl-tRNA synthetase